MSQDILDGPEPYDLLIAEHSFVKVFDGRLQAVFGSREVLMEGGLFFC
jgi:hypothetical protein